MKAVEAVEVARVGRHYGYGKRIAVVLTLEITRAQRRKFVEVGRNEEAARNHLFAQKVVLLRECRIGILENFLERVIKLNEGAG